MKKVVIPHILMLLFLAAVLLLPKSRPLLRPAGALLIASAVIEALFLFYYLRRCKALQAKDVDGSIRTPDGEAERSRISGNCAIMTFVWAVLLVWELATSVLHLAHPVLVPAPENVFFTFREQGKAMLINVAWSMELLTAGLVIGMVLAVLLGLFCGWNPKLKAFAYPIANVLAPIPAVVFSPYLVALMPTFRSASVLVVILGVFWPQFLGTVNRIGNMQPEIMDSARMLHLRTPVMLFRILLPALIPGILSGLKVTLTTSVLMLNFAELMGASHGMGYYVQNSIAYANYAHAVAGIIVIGIVVTILNRLADLAQRKLIKWH